MFGLILLCTPLVPRQLGIHLGEARAGDRGDPGYWDVHNEDYRRRVAKRGDPERHKPQFDLSPHGIQSQEEIHYNDMMRARRGNTGTIITENPLRMQQRVNQVLEERAKSARLPGEHVLDARNYHLKYTKVKDAAGNIHGRKLFHPRLQ